jgi:hypothetical protein
MLLNQELAAPIKQELQMVSLLKSLDGWRSQL